ncbi:MAG: YegS/Rv2252/BmrU family lipid kinase [Dehalococcoidia bacterium]
MPAPPERTAVVLANPAARRAIAPRVLHAAAEAMRARGWRVLIETAGSAGDTRMRAEQHARSGVDALLACGGDGTLLAVVNGVRAAGASNPPAVGIIPAGTANVWAAEARVPRDHDRALGLVETGPRRLVDVGLARIGDGPPVRFLLVCGAGLDAAAVETVDAHPAWKSRLGRFAYGAAGLATLATLAPVDAVIRADGDEVHVRRLLFALAANTHRYGGVVALTRRHALDDGRFEVTTFEGGAILRRLGLAVQALRGRLDERTVRGVTHRAAGTLTITPSRPLPVQVDGDSMGQCGPDAPLSVEVEHRALTMIFGR